MNGLKTEVGGLAGQVRQLLKPAEECEDNADRIKTSGCT